MTDKPERPDIYAICHRLVDRDTAAELTEAIETALGFKAPTPSYEAVAAALTAYTEAKGEHWNAAEGGRWTLRDLIYEARGVEAMFPS